MPIDFPNSPTVNQEYTINGVTWKYDGTAWNVISGGPGFRVSSAAPSSPATGDLWLESDSGEMFFYYDNQWVSPAVLATVGTSAIGTQQLASSAVTSQKALTSAASTITGTNSSGTSNALARADHNHDIKATGAFFVGRTTAQNCSRDNSTTIIFNSNSSPCFDVSGWYNTSTGYYTPQKQGYYRFTAHICMSAGGLYFANLMKNTSQAAQLGVDADGQRPHGTAILYMNGTTDYAYINIFFIGGDATETTSTTVDEVYFCGEYIGSP